MEKKNTDYQPIDCNLYDELILRIMRKQNLTICFHDATGKEIERKTRLTDVFAKDGEEFIVLENGEKIRLDKLTSIDGMPFEGSCLL